MYPSRFDYVAPASVDEALAILAERGDDAKVLAGGQSLVPLIKLRFASPGLVVDLNRLSGLSYIDETPEGLRIGALTRHCQLVDSEVLSASYPAMAAAAPLISDPLVRNRGTIGGSLAHADPAGDWGSVMLALGAQLVARSSGGERLLDIGEFFLGTFSTALEPNELVTEVRVPAPALRAGGTYLKLERKVGDFATVGVAVQVQLDDGVVGRAGIALTAVGPSNIGAKRAEATLVGAEPSESAFEEAARLAAQAAEPTTDVRGSAEYKRHVVEVYVKRGLAHAVGSAREA
jgi:aerobic carbon-monoxide dehydrogenase medium subunit